MCEDYDELIAFHYNAFRPALHAQILSSALGERCFEQGLDVGSGTGQSSIALAPFCNSVIGIEPSKAMLAHVITYPGVAYREFNGEYIPLKNSEFDIVTFAGSLYYAKSQALLNEVKRVSSAAATILVYDFDIRLEDIFKTFITNNLDMTTSIYNPEVDFAGLYNTDFNLLKKQQESTEIRLNVTELAHLILADKRQYLWLEGIFGSRNLFRSIIKQFLGISENGYFIIPVKLYYTHYTYLKP